MFVSILKVISSSNAGANLSYLIDEKAHDVTLTSHRTLAFGGQNVFLDWNNQINSRYLADQFWAVRQRAKNPGKRVQAQHLIFSFSSEEFSPNKATLKQDVNQIRQLVKSFMVEHFPKESQYLIAVQADSHGHNLHAHVTLNSVQTDGKVLNTNLVSVTGKDNIRDAFDKHMMNNFKNVTGSDWKPVTQNTDNLVNAKTVKVDERGGYVWKEDLKSRIIDAFSNVDNLDDFKAVLEANGGVHVKERRASIGKDENGNKKYRVAFTYSFTDADGHNRSSRDFAYTKTGAKRGLGLAFTPDVLSSAFKQRQNEQQVIDQEDVQTVSDDATETNDTSRRIELQQAINQLQDEEESEQDHGNQTQQSLWGDEQIDQIQFAEADTTGAEEQLNNQQARKLDGQRQRNQRRRQQRVEAEQASSGQSEHVDGRSKADRAKSSKPEPPKQATPTERSEVQSATSEPDDGPDF